MYQIDFRHQLPHLQLRDAQITEDPLPPSFSSPLPPCTTEILLRSPNLPPTGLPILPPLDPGDTFYDTADAGTIAGAVDSAAISAHPWSQHTILRSFKN